MRPAKIAIEAHCPAAPNSINDLRPNLSMVNTATQEAKKYSVPLHAASSRLRKEERPILVSKIVVA